jgi:hypothetical protein
LPQTLFIQNISHIPQLHLKQPTFISYRPEKFYRKVYNYLSI